MIQSHKAVLLGLLITFSSWHSYAAFTPECLSDGKPIAIDDQAVITMKTTTPNQYLARAHVNGTITNIFADETGHNHFEITMGPNPGDTLEVIYNISFGQLPTLQMGMSVEACGDFINSFAATSEYPESPDNAIIHWIHRNPSDKGHASGFLMIDGTLYGQGKGNVTPNN